MGPKKLCVVVVDGGESFDVLLHDGMVSGEILAAVCGRARLSGPVFCTEERSRSGMVIPLSASLPDGMTVFLHSHVAKGTERGGHSRSRSRSLSGETSGRVKGRDASKDMVPLDYAARASEDQARQTLDRIAWERARLCRPVAAPHIRRHTTRRHVLTVIL